MSVAYSDHFVSHGSGVVLYPGGGRCSADGSPIYQAASVSLEGGSDQVTDNAPSNQWAGCQAGDYICINPDDVSRVWRRIVAIDGAVATLDSTPGDAMTAVPATVGGAFGSIQWARSLVQNDAHWRSANGNPIRINIPVGVAFNEAVNDTGLAAGTSQYPIFIQAHTGTSDSPTWEDWTSDSGNRATLRPTAPLTITAATRAAQAVLTVGAGHNFGVGQTIKLASCAGAGEGTDWSTANANQTVVAVGATAVTISLDTSAYQTYTPSSGTASPFTATGAAWLVGGAAAYNRFIGLDLELAASGQAWYLTSSSAWSVAWLNCRAKAPSGAVYSGASGLPNVLFRRCLFEDSGDATHAAVNLAAASGAFEFNVIRNNGGAGLSYSGALRVCENLVCGNAGKGIVRTATSSWPAGKVFSNTVTDNALGGVDLGTQTTLELVLLHNNIIAHNGSSDTATISNANPAVVTTAATDFASLMPVRFSTTGTLHEPLATEHTYWAYRTGAKTYNLYDTLANATAHGATGLVATSSAGSGTHTMLVGWNVMASLVETNVGGHLLGLFEWNNIYGGMAGDILTSGGGADGASWLVDSSLHNDCANAPFTGSSETSAAGAAARLANLYALTSAARQTAQCHADAAMVSRPDLGAMQADAAEVCSPLRF